MQAVGSECKRIRKIKTRLPVSFCSIKREKKVLHLLDFVPISTQARFPGRQSQGKSRWRQGKDALSLVPADGHAPTNAGGTTTSGFYISAKEVTRFYSRVYEWELL